MTVSHLVFESVIEDSPERVFAFHERRDAFALLTPWWSGARVMRPAASLQPGESTLLVLGRWPLAREWEAVHEVYEPPMCFVESQRRGPFRRWRHRHLVLPSGSGARLRDELEYELPGGLLAPVLDVLLRPFLRRLFKYRHAVTRQHVLADAPRVTAADQLPVVVVGAGLAGLTCAQRLARSHVPVVILEASNAVGGRVRTETTPDGFVLDRGFQVLFTAYPALRRAVNLRELQLRPFDNGAAVVTPLGPRFIRDPLRHPRALSSALTSPLFTGADRLRLVRLALRLLAGQWDGVRDVPEVGRSTQQELYALGFSDRVIERFFRPFLAGIRLRRDLSTAASVAHFDLKMLVVGRSALPARGMQALPEAIATTLPSGCIRLKTPVLELRRDGQRVIGVRTPAGDVHASAVVLATDGDSTGRLSGFDVPRPTLGSTTLYLAGRQRLYPHKLLVLNALPDAFVNDATLLSNIAPEYAPPGWHLLAAHILDVADLDDTALDARARTDLQRWFPRVDLGEWRTVAVVRTPHSQFAQPVGGRSRLSAARTNWRGLYVAGEITQDSSINGALRSGESAARLVAADLGTRLRRKRQAAGTDS